MAFRWPRLQPRNALMGLFAVVWASVVLIREWRGTPVDLEAATGALVAGLTTLGLLFRRRNGQGQGDDREEQ